MATSGKSSSELSSLGKTCLKSILSSVNSNTVSTPEFEELAKEYAFFRIRINYLKKSKPIEFEFHKNGFKEMYLGKLNTFQKKHFIDIATKEYERLKNDPNSEYEE